MNNADEALTTAARISFAAAEHGNFRAVDPLLARLHTMSGPHPQAWSMALRAIRWSFDPGGRRTPDARRSAELRGFCRAGAPGCGARLLGHGAGLHPHVRCGHAGAVDRRTQNLGEQRGLGCCAPARPVERPLPRPPSARQTEARQDRRGKVADKTTGAAPAKEKGGAVTAETWRRGNARGRAPDSGAWHWRRLDPVDRRRGERQPCAMWRCGPLSFGRSCSPATPLVRRSRPRRCLTKRHDSAQLRRSSRVRCCAHCWRCPLVPRMTRWTWRAGRRGWRSPNHCLSSSISPTSPWRVCGATAAAPTWRYTSWRRFHAWRHWRGRDGSAGRCCWEAARVPARTPPARRCSTRQP